MTWQHNMATFMQLFHCNPQPEIQQGHRTTHTRRTTYCRTQRRKQLTSRNHRSRTRRTHAAVSIAGRSHVTRKDTRFDFLRRLPPKHKPIQHPPQDKPGATIMQPLQRVLQLQNSKSFTAVHCDVMYGRTPPFIAVYCSVIYTLTPPSIAAYCFVICSTTPSFITAYCYVM